MGEDRTADFYNRVDTFYTGERIGELEEYLRACRSLADAEGWPDGEIFGIAVDTETGTLYRTQGRWEESLSSFLSAAKRIALLYGKDCEAYATAQMNLAGTYRLANRQTDAIAAFEEALATLSSLPAADPVRIAATQNNLGLVYLGLLEQAQAKGSTDGDHARKALEQFEAALRTLDGTGKGNKPFFSERAATFHNLGTLAFLTGQYDEAKRTLAEAANLYQRLPEEERGHLGAVYYTRGLLFEKQNKKEEALADFHRARDWTYHFFGNNYEVQSIVAHIEEMEERRDENRRKN